MPDGLIKSLQLVANAPDWAKHRRRKAAAKGHLRLDLHGFLPRFALIDTARENDAKRAREVWPPSAPARSCYRLENLDALLAKAGSVVPPLAPNGSAPDYDFI